MSCTVADCTKPVEAKGLCAMHYHRQRRRGTTDARQPASRNHLRDEVIGANLRRIRAEREMSQAEFAPLLGIGQQHLARLELGQRRVSDEKLAELAARLGVSTHSLLSAP